MRRPAVFVRYATRRFNCLSGRFQRRTLAALISIVVCLVAAGGLGIQAISADTARTAREQAIDDHLTYTDQNVTRLELRQDKSDADRATRQMVMEAWKTGTQNAINDLTNRITAIASYGAGAFGALIIMQTLGLIRDWKNDAKSKKQG